MSNNINLQKDKRKGRRLLGLVLFVIAVLATTGIAAAYYSDSVQKSGTVISSTLDIEATHTVLLNRTETTLDDITNLNPGDVITVKGTVVNQGNQSAWIRDRFLVESASSAFFSALKFYDIELTQEELLSETDYTENELNIASGSEVVTNTRVIDGIGENAQTETGEDYAYIGSSTYDFVVTIYFMHTAGNETQGQNFTLSIFTEALQFRNNNAAEPDTDAWGTVAAL